MEKANKWKSIKRDYRNCIDYNSKSGNGGQKKCKHFEELNQLFGNKPSTQPVFVTDTSSRSHSCSSHGSDCSSSHSSSGSSSSRIYRVPYNSAATQKSDSDSSVDEENEASIGKGTVIDEKIKAKCSLGKCTDDDTEPNVGKCKAKTYKGLLRSKKPKASNTEKLINWMEDYKTRGPKGHI